MNSRRDLSPERVVDLAGTYFEIGAQHGVAHRQRIHDFLADDLARINALLYQPVTLEALAPRLRTYWEYIASCLPDAADELRGIAAGAEISLDEALVLQLRRELVGYQKIRRADGRKISVASGDCTTFGRVEPAGSVLGQTVDLNGHMTRELTVLRIRHARRDHRTLLLSFTGLLGYLGMNSHGLAVGLNLVLAGEWRPGIPGYMAIRHLLDRATSVDQALQLLDMLPLASSRALMLCDARRLVVVELMTDDKRIIEGPELAHTNHFLHPDFIPHDEINPFAHASSLRRLEACRAGLAALPVGCGADAYFDLLAEPPIYVDGDDDVRRECTVASVVMQPGRGRMTVRQGHPRDGAHLSIEV